MKGHTPSSARTSLQAREPRPEQQRRSKSRAALRPEGRSEGFGGPGKEEGGCEGQGRWMRQGCVEGQPGEDAALGTVTDTGADRSARTALEGGIKGTVRAVNNSII